VKGEEERSETKCMYCQCPGRCATDCGLALHPSMFCDHIPGERERERERERRSGGGVLLLRRLCGGRAGKAAQRKEEKGQSSKGRGGVLAQSWGFGIINKCRRSDPLPGTADRERGGAVLFLLSLIKKNICSSFLLLTCSLTVPEAGGRPSFDRPSVTFGWSLQSKVIIFGNIVITPNQIVHVQLYSCFASDKSISWQVSVSTVLRILENAPKTEYLLTGYQTDKVCTVFKTFFCVDGLYSKRFGLQLQ